MGAALAWLADNAELLLTTVIAIQAAWTAKKSRTVKLTETARELNRARKKLEFDAITEELEHAGEAIPAKLAAWEKDLRRAELMLLSRSSDKKRRAQAHAELLKMGPHG